MTDASAIGASDDRARDHFVIADGGVCDLKVAQLRTPLGLEDARPTFSWRMGATRAGALQTAYRIVVGSSQRAVEAGEGDLWDSGPITSDCCTGVAYEGPPLASRQRWYWSVTVWNERGEREGAACSWWEMGLLAENDWSASWLSAESALERDDREAGLVYVTAPMGAKAQTFILPFATDAAAACLLTVAVEGALQTLKLDGDVLQLPGWHEHAMGGRPAVRFVLELPPGEHELVADVVHPGGLMAPPQIAIAGQVRVTDRSGGTQRITTGWRFAVDEDGGDHASIAPAIATTQPSAPWPPAPARLMRRAFTAAAPIASARLYITALGAYEARLNGARVGNDQLAPEITDFAKRALYRVHDVGALLRKGDNVLALTVGDGWFASYLSPDGRFPFGDGPRRVRAQLEIVYDDGARETIATDALWRSATAPILSSEIYDGEDYDARLEQPGWDQAGFDDRTWDGAWVAPASPARLAALTSPPIVAIDRLRARSVSTPKDRTRVFDFGQNLAGRARVSVRAAAGDRIVLRFAELLMPDGTVDQRNLRAARACDTYIARGGADEVFEPHFTYHGFRYVQVEAGPADIIDIEAIVLSSGLDEVGAFDTGSSLVNQIWANTLWSQRSNFFGVPTDCPQRDERLGWSGDARVFWDAASYNMDVYAFTRRYMNDLRDAQHSGGAFPAWAPAGAKISASPLGAMALPGWSDAGVTLPWVAAHRSGDMSVIDENWDAMRRFVDGVLKANPDYVWRKGRGVDLGDWLSVDAVQPFDETTPKDLLATALLIRCFDHMADMARWTGRGAEASHYKECAAQGRQAFREFIAADGRVGNGSHTSYALTLALDLAPQAQRSQISSRFVEAIRERGTMLSCGFVGTPLALDAVAVTGDIELLYDLLLRTEYPSWGYMVKQGATSMWERWNSDAGDVTMNSFNHYAFGAVTGFFYRRIAGIEAVEPGFARLSMRPLVDPRLGKAAAKYCSVRGPISAAWRLEPGQLRYNVSLPANTTAEIELPVPRGRQVSKNPETELKSHEGGVAVFEIGAGDHEICVA